MPAATGAAPHGTFGTGDAAAPAEEAASAAATDIAATDTPAASADEISQCAVPVQPDTPLDPFAGEMIDMDDATIKRFADSVPVSEYMRRYKEERAAQLKRGDLRTFGQRKGG